MPNFLFRPLDIFKAIVYSVIYMASTRAATGVLNKLDKLETLLKSKTSWVKGAYAADADGEPLEDDQIKSKDAVKWCLVGGVERVGNGLQLYWELALTCDPELVSKTNWYLEDTDDTKDELEPTITGFNDNKAREHREILKAIRDTRKRVMKKGLTPLPKLRQTNVSPD